MKDGAAVVRRYEKEARRSPCGCVAVQEVGDYLGKPGYPITFAASAAGSGNCDEKRN
jgi:hypothetical protein